MKASFSRGTDGILRIESILEQNNTVRCMMDSADVIIETAL
jgi:hypothetical protein